MRTVNGGLLIILAFFILWIGVTGRFPRLIAAIGLVRGSNPNPPDGGSSGGNSSRNLGTTSPTISSAGIMPNLGNAEILSGPLGPLELPYNLRGL